jgi:C4-type Zn-finger protein
MNNKLYCPHCNADTGKYANRDTLTNTIIECPECGFKSISIAFSLQKIKPLSINIEINDEKLKEIKEMLDNQRNDMRGVMV